MHHKKLFHRSASTVLYKSFLALCGFLALIALNTSLNLSERHQVLTRRSMYDRGFVHQDTIKVNVKYGRQHFGRRKKQSVFKRRRHLPAPRNVSFGAALELVNRDETELFAGQHRGALMEEEVTSPSELYYDFRMRSHDSMSKMSFIGGKKEIREVAELCSKKTYELPSLGTASVIICFHGSENVYALLHTLHSIWSNTPRNILKEVIMIDDNSHKAEHKEPLENYCRQHFPGLVTFYRSDRQLGLIQGRLKGIEMASGDVVVVMDAHMELQPKWLEPLMEVIKNQKNTMASSYLDWMRPMENGSWTYEVGASRMRTTFVWKIFNFGFRFARQRDMSPDLTDPIDTPMSVGTVWAMNREFFFEIGALDPGMVLWGAENVDLPIRVVLCSDGRVVNVPCSHAAHQEVPHQRDYRYGWDKNFTKNYKRLVEVWFDDLYYKNTFYAHNQKLLDIDPGDLTERMALRQRCPHSISYYFNKHYPEMSVDAYSLAWRGVQNMGINMCLYISPMSHKITIKSCRFNTEKAAYQPFFLDMKGRLRHLMTVVNIKFLKTSAQPVVARGDFYESYYKQGSFTRWLHFKGGCLKAYKTDYCLSADPYKHALTLSPCPTDCPKDPFLRWTFKEYTKFYDDLVQDRFNTSSDISFYTSFQNYNHFENDAYR